MSKLYWPGGALLAPVPPCLITCAHEGRQNLLTVAWTGVLNTKPPRTYIAVRPERFSYELIEKSGEFVINLTTQELVRAADTCGVITGAKEDKFARCGLHTQPARNVGAPLLAESPLSLECKVIQVIPMETHHLFLADVAGVDVDPALVDEKGKLHLERAGLIAYAHGDYYALGERLGKFGFSVQKKKRRKAAK